MATVRELVVAFRLKADTKAIKNFEEKLSSAASAAKDLVSYGAQVAGAYAAAGGILGGLAASAADYAEETLRTSAAFGITTDKAQELSFAFQALGASQDDLADMFGTLTDRATDAMEGSKNYSKEFERIGIAVDDLKGKNPGELFDLYIQGVSNATSENEALTASVRLLGDDLGRRVARGLRLAGSSFEDYIKIAHASGGIFSKEMLDNAQRGQMQFRLLGATFQMLRRRIGLELAPVFGEFSAKIVRWFAMNSASVDEFVLRLKNGVQRELGRLEIVVKQVDRTVQSVFGGWTNLAESLALSLAGVVAANGAGKLITFLRTLAPLVAAITAPALSMVAAFAFLASVLAGVVLVFDDLNVLLAGGDSLIGELLDALKNGGPFEQWLGGQLQDIVDNFGAMLTALGKLGDEIAVLGPAVEWVGSVFLALFSGIVLGAANMTIWVVRGIVRIVRWFVLFYKIATAMFAALEEGFSNLGTIIVDAFKNAFAEVVAMASNLFGLLDIGIAEIFGKEYSIRGMADKMADNELPKKPLFPDSVTRGADGGFRRAQRMGDDAGRASISQSNQFEVNVTADTEAGGREAARGFKKEMESGGFFEGLKERFNYGDM